MDFASNELTRHIELNECKQQDEMLNLAYTLGTFTNGFFAFIWGFLLDKWGLRKVRLLINFFLMFGSYFLLITTKDRPYLVFPGVLLLSMSGVPLRIVNMQISNLFPKKQSTVISFYSGAFSASSFTFAIIKYAYDAGSSFYCSLMFLIIGSSFMLLNTFFLLPSIAIQNEESSESVESLKHSNSQNKLHEIFKKKHFETKCPVKLEKFNHISSFSNNKNNLPFKYSADIHSEGIIYQNNQSYAKIEDDISCVWKTETVLLKNSLFSISFLLHQWWFSWMTTYLIVYIGTLSLWISRVTNDNQTTNKIIQIFGGSQILALILAPLAGFWMDYQINKADSETDLDKKAIKRVQSAMWPLIFTLSTVLGSVLCHFFNNLIAIYISVIFLNFFRSFFVAIGTAYLRVRFPAEHYSKLLGIISTLAAVVTLLQYPLFIWELKGSNGPLWVNLFNCFCTLLSFLNPLHLAFGSLQKRLMTKEAN